MFSPAFYSPTSIFQWLTEAHQKLPGKKVWMTLFSASDLGMEQAANCQHLHFLCTK
jgi:hypothetical protein